MSFDSAIDDYLHLIVRTRPWTKKREEELLTEFEEWLSEQHGQRFATDEVTPELAAQYASAINLSMAEREELLIVLRVFSLWAVQQQIIASNQFELAVTL